MQSMTQLELADIYHQVNCVIIPSQWVETGPLVFHEAIECGCDVITTDFGGQEELAGVYHENASTFKHRDKENLYQLLSEYKPSSASGRKPFSLEEHFGCLLENLAIAG